MSHPFTFCLFLRRVSSCGRHISIAEQVTQLLQYWMRLCNENPHGEEKTSVAFLQVMNQRKVLMSDEVCFVWREGTDVVYFYRDYYSPAIGVTIPVGW